MSTNFGLNGIGLQGLQDQYRYDVKSAKRNNEEDTSVFGNNTNEVEETEETENSEKLAEELEQLMAEIDINNLDNIENSKLDEQIEEFKALYEKYEGEIDELKREIDTLADNAKEKIDEALSQQENLTEEYDDDAKKVLQDNIDAYAAANKEGGEGMTREQLSANIASSMPNKPNLSQAMSDLLEANNYIKEIDNIVNTKLAPLMSDAQNCQNMISQLTQTKVEQEAQAQAAQSCCPCPDPIGFVMGEGADKAQYDFIVDDGAFDSTSDFLGATDKWAAMEALDGNGDKTVTADELKAGNIKAVKTDAFGVQSIVDIADEFGEDFSVDLNSFTQGGSHSAIDTTSDEDGNGITDQTLYGTFNLNVNGQTIQGYDTIDDEAFLQNKYNLSAAGTSATASSASGIDSTETDNELESEINNRDFDSELNYYRLLLENLNTDLKDAYEKLGLTDEEIESINQSTKSEADEEAQGFYASLAKEDQEKIDEREKGETGINTEENEEEKEEKLREELAA